MLDLDPPPSFVRGILPVFLEGQPQMQIGPFSGHRSSHFRAVSIDHHYFITASIFMCLDKPSKMESKNQETRRLILCILRLKLGSSHVFPAYVAGETSASMWDRGGYP